MLGMRTYQVVSSDLKRRQTSTDTCPRKQKQSDAQTLCWDNSTRTRHSNLEVLQLRVEKSVMMSGRTLVQDLTYGM